MGHAQSPNETLAEHAASSKKDGVFLKMTERAREICYAAATGAVGIFFLTQATSIEASQDDLVGPQSIPLFVSCLIIALALLQIVLLVAGRGEEEQAQEATMAAAPGARQNGSAMVRMAAVIALGFAYIWLFSLAGYLISTAVVLGALLVVFGNRSAARVSLLTFGGALIYYIVFIHFMGIQDSMGWHLDLSSLGLR